MDLLNERGQEVLRLADINNKKMIESQLSEINSEWRELVSGLEGRKDALEALSRHWEHLEAQWALIETRLTVTEEKNKLIDTVVRSKQHLHDTIKVLEVSNDFSNTIKSTIIFLLEKSYSYTIINNYHQNIIQHICHIPRT